MKTAGLLVGVVLPVVGLADALRLGHVVWAMVIAAVTSFVLLLAWRFPGVIGVLLVVAALLMVPVAIWAVGFGMGMAEKTAHLGDYLRAVVLLPGSLLLAGALLFLASHRASRP